MSAFISKNDFNYQEDANPSMSRKIQPGCRMSSGSIVFPLLEKNAVTTQSAEGGFLARSRSGEVKKDVFSKTNPAGLLKVDSGLQIVYAHGEESRE